MRNSAIEMCSSSAVTKRWVSEFETVELLAMKVHGNESAVSYLEN